jgi:hypothetical protein
MGLLKVAKKAAAAGGKARAAVAARNGECQVCGKTIRGGARKGNTCSVACAQFIAMSW